MNYNIHIIYNIIKNQTSMVIVNTSLGHLCSNCRQVQKIALLG